LGNKKEAIQSLEYSMKLAPLSPSIKGTLGFAFACAGEYDRSHALLHEALDLNPYCPWWYHIGFFIVYYQNKKYEEALRYTQKMNASEDVYLVPLFALACKGELGITADAQTEVVLLTEKFPEILADLKIYLSTFLLDESLINEIIRGTKKAGLIIT
jgi:tetratricopeptide (TPR) repeat protein